MNSAAKAIAWDIWSRNRFALTAVAIGLPITFIPGAEWFRVFQALFFMFAIAILYWSFCYVEVDARGRHAGFPSRMFVLPLPTGVLAGLPMIYGACTIAVFYLFWSHIVLPIWGVRLSGSWVRVHTLTLVAMMLSLQAIVWSLYRFPWIRMLLVALLLIGIGAVGLLAPAHDFRKMSERQIELTLAVVSLLAFVGGIAGVARDRRGEWEGWTQRLIDAALRFLPRGPARFKSGADAQLWFEWRGKALFSCVVVLISMLFPLLICPLPTGLQMDSLSPSFYTALPILTLSAAWALGFNLAKTDYWSRGHGLSPFVTARPLSSGDIVVAKFKAAALVTLTVALLFALLAIPVFNIPHWWWNSEDHKFPSLSEFVRQNPALISTITHPVVVLTALLVMWTTIVDSLALGLKPRKQQLAQSILKVALVIGALILAGWCMDTPRGRRELLKWLPLATALMVTWKVTSTAIAFARARRFYSCGQFLGTLGLWVTTALLIIWAASIVWTDISAIDRTIAFFAAWLLPGAALARAPINLDRSRHA